MAHKFIPNGIEGKEKPTGKIVKNGRSSYGRQTLEPLPLTWEQMGSNVVERGE